MKESKPISFALLPIGARFKVEGDERIFEKAGINWYNFKSTRHNLNPLTNFKKVRQLIGETDESHKKEGSKGEATDDM